MNLLPSLTTIIDYSLAPFALSCKVLQAAILSSFNIPYRQFEERSLREEFCNVIFSGNTGSLKFPTFVCIRHFSNHFSKPHVEHPYSFRSHIAFQYVNFFLHVDWVANTTMCTVSNQKQSLLLAYTRCCRRCLLTMSISAMSS